MRFLLHRPTYLSHLLWVEKSPTPSRVFPACWLGILSRSVRGRRPGPWEFSFRVVESDGDWLLGYWETQPLKGLRENSALHRVKGYAWCVADWFGSTVRCAPVHRENDRAAVEFLMRAGFFPFLPSFLRAPICN